MGFMDIMTDGGKWLAGPVNPCSRPSRDNDGSRQSHHWSARSYKSITSSPRVGFVGFQSGTSDVYILLLFGWNVTDNVENSPHGPKAIAQRSSAL